MADPGDWRAYVDASSQCMYYYSRRLRRTTWTAPPQFVVASAVPSAPADRAGDPPRLVVDVRGGWKCVRDPSSGDVYYVHRRTRATQWEKPREWDSTPAATPPQFPPLSALPPPPA